MLSTSAPVETAARVCTERIEDGTFFATSPEFPGLWGSGDTSEAAIDDFTEGIPAWVALTATN